MNIHQNDRRTPPGGGASGDDSNAATVTKALVVQQLSGTVSAIEYLKNNDVSAPVIQRVLCGTAVRHADAQALRDLAVVAH